MAMKKLYGNPDKMSTGPKLTKANNNTPVGDGSKSVGRKTGPMKGAGKDNGQVREVVKTK